MLLSGKSRFLSFHYHSLYHDLKVLWVHLQAYRNRELKAAFDPIVFF